MRYYFAIFLASCCLMGCGSGSNGPATYSVDGNVTFDGAPLPDGQIIFRPANSDESPMAGPIANGKYNLKLTAGEKLVSITASRPIPGKFDTSNPGEQTPVVEQYIPETYNSRTTLKVNIVSDGAHSHDFDLKSQP